MFRFAQPWWLAALPLAAGATFWLLRSRRRARPRLPLPDAGALASIGGIWPAVDALMPWLRGAAIALAIVALARPQWGNAVENISSLGVDIVVAIDISGSMRCMDEPPRDRLPVARESLVRFVEGRPGDRLGLVAFGGVAALRCPLTLDHTLLLGEIGKLDFAPEDQSGTAIGMGLASAVQRLRASKAKSRVVVLLTDGINNQGQVGPEAAASAAKALGVRVYTIGVGSRGEVRCAIDTPFGKRLVWQRQELDERLLKAIADDTGGLYFRATEPAGLEEAFRRIDALEKTEFESRIRVLWNERFGVFLAWAGALALVEVLLAATRLRRIP
jgi:Ca-activated chloride channel family protein